jgi:cytochrome bd ubiquinol oxidase subunit II
MMGFTDLQFIWWVLIGAVLIIYAATAGFDFGATMLLPFMRKESDRRVILNASGRTWDGNQTWIVFAGGGLFVIWPAVYAATFSGLYAAILIILWSFFLRPPGFDFRAKIDSHIWRRFWDLGLFVSAFFPMLIFGVAFGNLLQGLPLSFSPISLRSFYHGNFWGLINWMGIIAGVVAILMALMHGAAMLNRRTEGDLKRRMQRLFYIFGVLLLIVFTGGGFMVAYAVKGYVLVHSPANATLHPLSSVVTRQTGAWFASYAQYPWKAAAPIVAYIGIVLAMITLKLGKGAFAFWMSVVAIAGVVATAGTALFPFIVPSSFAPAQSMTVWNATSAQYTLNAMLYVTIPLLAFILCYKIFAYWAVWRGKGTLDSKDVAANEHEYY